MTVTMMHRLVGTYLTSFLSSSHVGAPQSLCIVETRQNFWLPHVIRNAVQEFPGWTLYVAAPDHVHLWLARVCPCPQAITLRLNGGGKGVEPWNRLMFDPAFWDVITTDYVLLFQCDTVFAPGALSKLPPLTKDFYGAACGVLEEESFVINGGLSLRKASAFARACTLLTEDLVQLPEDVAFTRIMRAHPDVFALPSIAECMSFAIESEGDPTTVIGIHGTDKNYAPNALLASCLQMKPCMPVYDVMMYDGEPILDARIKLLSGLVHTFVVVEARYTHSGRPKELRFDPAKYPANVRYVVIDEFPPMPPTFTTDCGMPWVTPETAEAWWREMCQRDVALHHLPGEPGMIVCSDVDEIPDPSVLCDLTWQDIAQPLHLDMVFLVHAPEWVKPEPWRKPFVCSTRGAPASLTAERCMSPSRVVAKAGWHCSSFFDVDSHIRKVQHFAHREFGSEVDAEVIRERLESGKDPYGRGPEFDCVSSTDHLWLRALL